MILSHGVLAFPLDHAGVVVSVMVIHTILMVMAILIMVTVILLIHGIDPITTIIRIMAIVIMATAIMEEETAEALQTFIMTIMPPMVQITVAAIIPPEEYPIDQVPPTTGPWVMAEV